MLTHTPKALALQAIAQRKKLKLSQLAVGKRVGLKQQTVSAFEQKPNSTKLDTLFRILSALELDIYTAAKKNQATVTSEWKEEW